MTKKIYGKRSKFNFLLGEIKPPKTVLDLGCGYGRDLIPLQKKGFICTGIDDSKEFIEILNKEAPEIKTYKKDFTKFFPKKKFDIIIADMSLQFIKNKGEFAKTIDLMKERANEYNVIKMPLLKRNFIFPTAISSKKELEEMYQDWKIIYSKVKRGKLSEPPISIKVVYFLAKKIN